MYMNQDHAYCYTKVKPLTEVRKEDCININKEDDISKINDDITSHVNAVQRIIKDDFQSSMDYNLEDERKCMFCGDFGDKPENGAGRLLYNR